MDDPFQFLVDEGLDFFALELEDTEEAEVQIVVVELEHGLEMVPELLQAVGHGGELLHWSRMLIRARRQATLKIMTG